MSRSGKALAIAAALVASAVRAEVSVDHVGGTVVPRFILGPNGPWNRARLSVPERDVLNEQGDVTGCGAPRVHVNAGTHVPEVVWETGGPSSDVFLSRHDGWAWTPPRNLSLQPGRDELPVIASAGNGVVFVAWCRPHALVATALVGDEQAAPKEISTQGAENRRPSIAVLEETAYLAHERVTSGGDGGIVVGVDRVRLLAAPVRVGIEGGENSIDFGRLLTVPTNLPSSAVAETRVHSEQGHLWVTWVHSPSVVGWSELSGDTFSTPAFRVIPPNSNDEATRDAIRDDITKR